MTNLPEIPYMTELGPLENGRNRFKPQRNSEVLHPVEIKEGEWKPLFAVLTVSGMAGRGNSSLADSLAHLYGIPEDRVFHGGDIIKKIKAEQGVSILGPYERDPKIDKLVDDEILRLIITATTENPVIIESKLAGLFMHRLEHVAEEKNVNLPAPRWSIVKEATPEKSAEIQAKKGKLQDIPEDLMIGYITGRDEQDETHWRNLYDDWMRGWTNILRSDAKCDKGYAIYNDHVVAGETPEQDAREAHLGLVRVGLVEEIAA